MSTSAHEFPSEYISIKDKSSTERTKEILVESNTKHKQNYIITPTQAYIKKNNFNSNLNYYENKEMKHKEGDNINDNMGIDNHYDFSFKYNTEKEDKHCDQGNIKITKTISPDYNLHLNCERNQIFMKNIDNTINEVNNKYLSNENKSIYNNSNTNSQNNNNEENQSISMIRTTKTTDENTNNLNQNNTNDILSSIDLKQLPTILNKLQTALQQSNINGIEMKETISELLKKEIQSKAKIKEQETELTKIKEELLILKESENNNKEKLSKLKTNNLALTKENEVNCNLTLERDLLLIELDKYKEKCIISKTKEDILNNEIKELNIELKNKKNEVNNFNKEKTELIFKLEEAEEKCNKCFYEEKEKYDFSVLSYKTKLNNLESTVKDMTNSNIKLKKENQELNYMISQLKENNQIQEEKLIDNNNNTNNQITELKRNIKEDLIKIIELNKNKEKQEFKNQVLTEDLERLTHQINSYIEENRNLLNENNKKTEKIEILYKENSRISFLTSEIESLNKDVYDLKLELDFEKEKNNEKIHECDGIKKEFDRVCSEYEEYISYKNDEVFLWKSTLLSVVKYCFCYGDDYCNEDNEDDNDINDNECNNYQYNRLDGNIEDVNNNKTNELKENTDKNNHNAYNKYLFSDVVNYNSAEFDSNNSSNNNIKIDNHEVDTNSLKNNTKNKVDNYILTTDTKPKKENKELNEIKSILNISQDKLKQLKKIKQELYKTSKDNNNNTKDNNNETNDKLNTTNQQLKQTLKTSDTFLTKFKEYYSNQHNHLLNYIQLNDNLINEIEKNNFLSQKLNEEKYFRRKIHNTYLQTRGNIRVMCRIRPFIKEEIKIKQLKYFYKNNFFSSNQMIKISVPNNSNQHFNSNNIHNSNSKEKAYNFDYIFNQSTLQNEVSEEISMLIDSLINGKNVSVISYGQTGAGKTYTIEGNKHNPGLVYHSLKELFRIKEELDEEHGSSNTNNNNNTNSHKRNSVLKISLSVIEIYNDQIFNLFDESKQSLEIYEDNNHNLNIPELHPVEIHSFSDAMKLIKIANKLKTTKENNYNIKSSRSHTIFTFHIKNRINNSEINAKMNIIDLAGSERLSKSLYSDNNDILRKEAININLSLTSLSGVLNAIISNQKHVPFRNCKLTHLLKESFTHSFNILVILHISPCYTDLNETISTLNFGKGLFN